MAALKVTIVSAMTALSCERVYIGNVWRQRMRCKPVGAQMNNKIYHGLVPVGPLIYL